MDHAFRDEGEFEATWAQPGTGTGATSEGEKGIRVVDLASYPLMDKLLKESDRNCNNIGMIVFFWSHWIAMASLIFYVMTHDATAETSSYFESVVDFVAKSETGHKLFGVMIGTCLTGGLFSIVWVWFLRYFRDNSIKVSILTAHLIVLSLLIWEIVGGATFFVRFYGAALFFADLWLYCHRKDFPFSEVMMKIGTECVSENPKMQMFAYAFMPMQVITYIFWLMGMLYCFAFDWGVDNWYIILVLFMFSYNWTGWFWHFMVHSFVTVLSAFWLLGMDGGFSKATKSCKASMTYSQGPIAIGSFIMAWLSILKFIIRWSLRSLCCCVGDFVYKFCCKCLEKIIQRYNEYVLAIVNLLDVGFFAASGKLGKLFTRTGMSFITNEVAWSVPISVGTFCGYCISGGMGLAYHKLAFAADENLSTTSYDVVFFIVYAILGGSVTAIGLAPLRSVLTSVFVIWSEEPTSFAAGKPHLYGELMIAIEKSPGVNKNIKDPRLLRGNEQVDL